MAHRNMILKGGIWKKKERDLIAQIKLHPPLYEVNGLLIYGKKRYLTSWNSVSKHLGVPVDICKKEWMKIEQDYNKQLWNLKDGNKSFSKCLDGTLDFLKPRVTDVVSCSSSDTVLTDSDSDIEYVGSVCSNSVQKKQSKTQNDKVNDNEISKLRNTTVLTTQKHLKINSNVDQKNKNDSELKNMLLSGPKKMTTSIIKNKKHYKSNTVKQSQSQLIRNGRHGKQRKTSSIIEDYRSHSTRQKQALCTKKSDSRKKDSVVGVDDISSIRLSSDEDELKEVATDKETNSSNTSLKPGISFAITEDLIQSLLLKTVESDTNHTNANEAFVNFLGLNKTIDPGTSHALVGNLPLKKTKETPRNSGTTHSVTKEVVDSLLLHKTMEDSAKPVVSHTATERMVESMDINPLNKTIQSNETNTLSSPMLYLAKNEGSTLIITPYIVLDCAHKMNSIDAEKNPTESVSAKVQDSTTVASLNAKKTESILDVDSQESDMNIFFDKLAEYVSNTYPLQKQMDLRSKLCSLVSAIELEDID